MDRSVSDSAAVAGAVAGAVAWDEEEEREEDGAGGILVAFIRAWDAIEAPLRMAGSVERVLDALRVLRARLQCRVVNEGALGGRAWRCLSAWAQGEGRRVAHGMEGEDGGGAGREVLTTLLMREHGT